MRLSFWWCPNGCGKRVRITNKYGLFSENKWKCRICEEVYSKKDLSELNPKILTRKTNPYKDNI